MPQKSRSERRDPWWGWDGEAVLATRRRRRARSALAFVVSLFALGGAAGIWAVYLGVAAGIGVRFAFGVH